MITQLQVLSKDERAQIHERTLKVLANTGLRVDTAWGRQILEDAGAEVNEDTHLVRFPRELVEESLRLAPQDFTLGARRPGWNLRMNAGDCALVADGSATFVLDRETGQRRLATQKDWREATTMLDALDEIGVYWHMVEASDAGETLADYVEYLHGVFGNFSKHVQDANSGPEYAPWLLEVLQVVFGDRETIRREHPLSFLLCPQSPLIIEGTHTDAYLALLGWDIPVAVMPMPLMGATGPGSLISTTILGNCEVLAMLCLIQAAAPGTPFIYAPALSITDPRTMLYAGGAIENGLMSAASVEMARYYGLPVEGTGIGTNHFIPGIQASYERALNGMLPMLAWPDLLVGAGLLGGSMVLSFGQLVIDSELFRIYQRAHQGIASDEDKWLDDVISRVGPGGGYLAERSTVKGVRDEDRWYVSEFGMHDTYSAWEADGKPTLMQEAREQVNHILENHQPLPLGEDAERELARIQERAKAEA
jgi:trimethylamine--corrinoid protein Co-methyltransferase